MEIGNIQGKNDNKSTKQILKNEINGKAWLTVAEILEMKTCNKFRQKEGGPQKDLSSRNTFNQLQVEQSKNK